MSGVVRSFISRKLISHSLWTPPGARRGFFEFEWPSFRTEAFRRRDDRDRKDQYVQKPSSTTSENDDNTEENFAESLVHRDAKSVWESITRGERTAGPKKTPQSSSSSGGSQQKREYRTSIIHSCAVQQQTRDTADQPEDPNYADQQSQIDDKNSIKELYKCDQALTIRAMGIMGGFNVLFWGQYMASIFIFDRKSVIIQDIEVPLAGDPLWGFAGVFGTGMILYSTYMFATHAVNRAYLTSDKQRIGFQIHNMWGNPGKILEVKLGLAKMVSMPGIISKTSSYIPVKIEGKSKNVILDESGSFEDDKELLKLLDESQEALIQSKEERRRLGREGGGAGMQHRYNQRNTRRRR